MLKVLGWILVCILAFLLIRYLLLPLLKWLLYLIKWLLITLPIWIICLFVPTFIEELGFFVFVAIIAFIDAFKNKLGNSGGVLGTRYILNKRTKVLHYPLDPSARMISQKNREEIYLTDSEIVARGYRVKKM